MWVIKFLVIVGVRYLPTVLGFECSNFDTNMGATFDLTDLVRYYQLATAF